MSKKIRMLLTMLFTCHHFRSWWGWTFPLGGLLLCPRVITVNEAARQKGCIVGGHMMKFLQMSDPSWSHIRPDTQLQIKEHKKSTHICSCTKFYVLTPKMSITVMYHCIALLQLLYRWQYPSWKLWMYIVSLPAECKCEIHHFYCSLSSLSSWWVIIYCVWAVVGHRSYSLLS
jgi:hypothetical protein